ncbi:MAG: cation-translocating P-type ATPase [Fibrobacteres bacterium]|jgi:Ca2+-transporting ATPase|nr:cation-translocating P-type ATPase [Fibrobacterota bacterium]
MTPPDGDAIAAYRLSPEACAANLDTDPGRGLTADEARSRLERDGRNELDREPSTPAWRLFLEQFRSVLVLLLVAAATISLVLWLIERGSALPYDSMAIFAVVLLNATIGFMQQKRSQSAVEALQKMSSARARVIRDGNRQMVDAADIVTGDLLAIEEGDSISADARVVESTELRVAEAALTGESAPVSKRIPALELEVGLGDRVNMVFCGTAASSGRGLAIVVATGMRTEMGNIAGMLARTPHESTPLEIELGRIGKVLAILVAVIALGMIATIVVADHVQGWSSLFEVFMLGVALAVAAVPEGLPALVTAVLALGVQRMAKRNAIVRHLAAVETLGSANVIASDKTGTLTKNEMTVRTVVVASGRVEFGGTGYAPAGEVMVAAAPGLAVKGVVEGPLQEELGSALVAADRSSNALVTEIDGHWTVQGDPTEGALVVAARKTGLATVDMDNQFARQGEIPFSSERRMMSTIHNDPEKTERLWVFAKGAPDSLLERCETELVGDYDRPLTPERRKEILSENDNLAGQALRTLAVARRSVLKDGHQPERPDPALENAMVFLGLVGMIDPPRKEAKDAVARTKSAGIRPIMITGDHPLTASVIAAELGIASDGGVVTGAELAVQTDEQLDRTVAKISVYARVDPGQKLRIVQALRKSGAVVAMTGDGVNDAPALKAADIGVAMGLAGTDVSREAADVVLVDDNYATIVAAVEEGRAIFANIRKFLRYLLSSNIGEVMTMFFGVVFTARLGLQEGGLALVLPLLATQILWVNLVTDSAPALALGVDPPDDDLMDRPPRPRGEGVVTWHMWTGIVMAGAVVATGTLLVLDASLPGGMIEGTGDMRYGRTMAFTTLVLFQLFNCFQSRSDTASVFHGLFRNGWLWGAVGLSLALQVAVVHVPMLQRGFSTTALTLNDWLLCAAVASSILWAGEAVKLVLRMAKGVRNANKIPAMVDLRPSK